MTRSAHVRDTLDRALSGRWVTWVHEPGRVLPVPAWPLSQVLHAYALAGPRRYPGLRRGLLAYRHRGGFRETPGRGRRYVDDNAWLGLAVLQWHRLTGSPGALRTARAIDAFVRTGCAPGGGIRWVEGGQTLNACSTGAGALLHAELGGDIAAHLEFLRQLRDAHGLVRDHLRPDGSIDPSLYSYNQGLLIAAALAAGDRDTAGTAADAAVGHFRGEVLWAQPVAFNAVLCRALLRLGRAGPVAEYADRLWEQGREDGWFTRAGRYDGGKVLDTAAALQIMALADHPGLVRNLV